MRQFIVMRNPGNLHRIYLSTLDGRKTYSMSVEVPEWVLTLHNKGESVEMILACKDNPYQVLIYFEVSDGLVLLDRGDYILDSSKNSLNNKMVYKVVLAPGSIKIDENGSGLYNVTFDGSDLEFIGDRFV